MKICLDAGHYGKYNRSPVNYAYYSPDAITSSWEVTTQPVSVTGATEQGGN